MSIEEATQDLLVVTLPQEPHINDTLIDINEMVASGRNCDVIIDFSRVETLNSSTLSNLLILRDMLEKMQRRLFLCQVAFATKCIFMVTGIEELFEFANDKYVAMEIIRSIRNNC